MISTINVIRYIIMYIYSIGTTSLSEFVRNLNAPASFTALFEMA